MTIAIAMETPMLGLLAALKFSAIIAFAVTQIRSARS